MSAGDVAGQLYGLAPDEFTAARDAAARTARDDGDRELATEIKSWRRPSIGAWLVNQVVRTHNDELDDLLDLGAALREAQEALDGAELRALSRQRHQVIRALTEVGRAVAREQGQNLGDAAQREFEATLDAALADGPAAEAVRTGRLMRALASGGLDAVDLDGAVAAPDESAPPRKTRAKPAAKPKAASGPPEHPKRDDTAVKESEQALRAAEKALSARDKDRAAAHEAESDARRAVADLERSLDDARVAFAEAQAAKREADQAHKLALRARDTARRDVDTARRKNRG